MITCTDEGVTFVCRCDLDYVVDDHLQGNEIRMLIEEI